MFGLIIHHFFYEVQSQYFTTTKITNLQIDMQKIKLLKLRKGTFNYLLGSLYLEPHRIQSSRMKLIYGMVETKRDFETYPYVYTFSKINKICTILQFAETYIINNV